MNPDVVLHMRDAGGHFGKVLGPTAKASRGDGARQDDFTLPHLNLYIRRIDERIVGKALADVLTDPLVGPLVTLRASAPMRPRIVTPVLVLLWSTAVVFPVGGSEGSIAGTATARGRIACIVPRAATSIIDESPAELVRVLAVAAGIFAAAQSPRTDSAGGDVTVTVIVVEWISRSLAIVHHGCSPVADSSNNPISA
jgi:hypothetical protein